jgi:hypothetical protein
MGRFDTARPGPIILVMAEAQPILLPFPALFGTRVLVGIIPALFGTRVLVRISGDNPHQTPNPRSLLKICSVLEYWVSLIPTNPHFPSNFSVFLSIPNTLPLPSELWVEF